MSRQTANTALKRLMTEYKQLTASESEDSMFTAGMYFYLLSSTCYSYFPPATDLGLPSPVTAGPVTESDFFTWSCLISGPSDTPFEGGIFEAELKFPRDYPLSPPKVPFLSFPLCCRLPLTAMLPTDEVQPTSFPSQHLRKWRSVHLNSTCSRR